ncbi:MAG: nucleotide exchange factor GrpE [Alphaproteobacteria bacterium]
MIDDPRTGGDEPSPANDEAAAEAPAAPAPEDGEAAQAGELAKVKDQLLRALAELENTRRRARKEVEDASRFAVSGFARDCLSVADNLERALASVPGDALQEDARLAALHEGVAMTRKELAAVLERHGVKQIEAEGQRFDPNLHQAMLEVPTDDHPPGTVVQVLQVGYTVAGRLLRPAMVTVAKAAGGAGEAEADSRGGRLDTSA